MVTYKIHMIRHGMTDGNRTGRYVGRLDVPLCLEGRQELEALSKQYEYPAVQEVYCSPLTRCVQTADFFYPDVPRTIVENLVELSLGVFEGQYMKDLKDNPDYLAWLKQSLTNTPPGAVETAEEFGQRIATALQQIFANMTQNHITEAAVIAHGGVLMGLLSAFAMPRCPMGEWAIGNGCGYTVRMSTQLWMRDQIIEVIAPVPFGHQGGQDPRVKESLGVL